MFLLMKGRNVSAHLMKVGHGFTIRREHPDRRPSARLKLIQQFVKIHGKEKGDKLTDAQKKRKGVLGKQLLDSPWVDEKGREIKNEKTLERIKNLKIGNPAIVEARVASDPDDELQAITWFINVHGEKVKDYRYTTTHKTESADAKWVRSAKLSLVYGEVRDAVATDAAAGVEEAIILHMMFLTNMRVSNKGKKATKKKAYGATTLQARHLRVKGDTVFYAFDGKSGVWWEGSVKDAVFAGAIKSRLASLKKDERIFSVGDADVNKYFRDAGNFTTRDIRPLHGTSLAKEFLRKSPQPKDLKGAKELVKEICGKVAIELHHDSPNTTKSKYIDPIVWAEIEEEFGIKVLKPVKE